MPYDVTYKAFVDFLTVLQNDRQCIPENRERYLSLAKHIELLINDKCAAYELIWKAELERLSKNNPWMFKCDTCENEAEHVIPSFQETSWQTTSACGECVNRWHRG